MKTTIEWSLPQGYHKKQFADIVDDMISISKKPHLKNGRIQMNVSAREKTLKRFNRSFTVRIENIFGKVRIIVS